MFWRSILCRISIPFNGLFTFGLVLFRLYPNETALSFRMHPFRQVMLCHYHKDFHFKLTANYEAHFNTQKHRPSFIYLPILIIREDRFEVWPWGNFAHKVYAILSCNDMFLKNAWASKNSTHASAVSVRFSNCGCCEGLGGLMVNIFLSWKCWAYCGFPLPSVPISWKTLENKRTTQVLVAWR